MDIKDRSKYVLATEQRSHPVVDRISVEPIACEWLTTDMVQSIFGTKQKGLKMWSGKGRQPHWLATRNGINLHTDPGYDRYAVQMVIKNDGWRMTGYDKSLVTDLMAGDVYVLDTHSPHELFRGEQSEGRFFVAVGFDVSEIKDGFLQEAAVVLSKFARGFNADSVK